MAVLERTSGEQGSGSLPGRLRSQAATAAWAVEAFSAGPRVRQLQLAGSRSRSPFAGRQPRRGAQPRLRVFSSLLLAMVLPLLTGLALLIAPLPAMAITAPELRSQRSLQELQPDMHGRNLQQQEFLKADLEGFDFSESDLRGAVFNGSNLQGADLHGADLEDVVAYASRFEGADLRDAVLRNGMLMQSHFRDALIEGADFSDAVLDLPERKALCARASGSNGRTGISTRDSLECR